MSVREPNPESAPLLQSNHSPTRQRNADNWDTEAWTVLVTGLAPVILIELPLVVFLVLISMRDQNKYSRECPDVLTVILVCFQA